MHKHPEILMNKTLRNALAAFLVATPLAASAVVSVPNIQITEWMYNGNGATGEYIEFTNLGESAVDFTNWSFDDSSRAAGSVSLSALGTIAAGQSFILTEASADAFIAAWGLGSSTRVIGGNTNNLGRADEINIYDASGVLVDRLTYGDLAIAGTLRAQNISGNPFSLAALDSHTVTSSWVLAAAGDAYGSYASSMGDVGNPGLFALAVPEPSRVAMLLAGLGLLGGIARRRSLKGD